MAKVFFLLALILVVFTTSIYLFNKGQLVNPFAPKTVRILKSTYVQDHAAVVTTIGSSKQYTGKNVSMQLPLRWMQDPNNSQRVFIPLSDSAKASTNNILLFADIQIAVVPSNTDEIQEMQARAALKKALTINGLPATAYISYTGQNNTIYYQSVVIMKNSTAYVITLKTARNDSMGLIPEFAQILTTVTLY